ncbi:MAG: hypothetical protein KBS54_01715 [Synergistaceae bacterium]|nr:hypothetical protein [Candidatus Equadaptatus faecalis]
MLYHKFTDDTTALKIIRLFAIKYLYVYLAIDILGKLWYSGTSGYQIDFNIHKEYVASVVFFVLSWLHIRLKSHNKFTDTVVHILFLLYFIPLNSAFALNNLSWEFFVYSSVYLFLVQFVVCIPFYKTASYSTEPEFNFADAQRPNKRKKLQQFCVCMCIGFVFIKFIYNGMSFTVSLSDVYILREANHQRVLAMAGGILPYMITVWQNTIIYAVYFGMYCALKYKKKVALLVTLLCVLAMFSIDGSKAVIFFVVVVYFVYWCDRNGMLNRFDKMADIGLLLFMVLCLLIYKVCENFLPYIYIIRREMYMPAWINGMYYDFFSTNAKLLWSDRTFLLQRLITSPYKESILDIISREYFHGAVRTPNTGMFADAYMQCGVLGVLIYPILYRLIFKWAGKIFKEYGNGIEVLFGIFLAIQLTNIPLLNTGIILSLVFFAYVAHMLPNVVVCKHKDNKKKG